jgi:Ni,Fe-hydrogenase maturation factor
MSWPPWNCSAGLPKHTAILGLQPQSLALGMELSREVEAGMPELLRMVVDELAMLGISASPLAGEPA